MSRVSPIIPLGRPSPDLVYRITPDMRFLSDWGGPVTPTASRAAVPREETPVTAVSVFPLPTRKGPAR